MTESDQRTCDQRHEHIDAELLRIRERLDGNGSTGICGRLKTVETIMEDFKTLRKSLNALSIAVVILALLTGADVGLKAAPLLKLIIP